VRPTARARGAFRSSPLLPQEHTRTRRHPARPCSAARRPKWGGLEVCPAPRRPPEDYMVTTSSPKWGMLKVVVVSWLPFITAIERRLDDAEVHQHNARKRVHQFVVRRCPGLDHAALLEP
jgi:hypothetical protein